MRFMAGVGGVRKMFGFKSKQERLALKQQKQLEKEMGKYNEQKAKVVAQYQKMTKRQLLLQRIEEIEQVIEYCKIKAWLTKADWKTNDVPMIEMTREILKLTKAYVDERHQELKQEIRECGQLKK
jgi:inactivated superfamily I helicase